MARLFVVLAFLALASAQRDRCPITCSDATGLIQVDHDASSSHNKHRCYMNDQSDCECECRETTGHTWISNQLTPVHCSGSWVAGTACTPACDQTCFNEEVYSVTTGANELGNPCPATHGQTRTSTTSTTSGPACTDSPTLAPTAAPTVIAHGSCPPGSYYTGYSDVQLGSCASCPPNTYSGAWTSVGETCKAHTLTCSQGEFLQGASSVSKGSCATCPAGTYNDDASHRDSSCDFHGMCPPGQEPSNLSSKTSATQCSPCAPGTYSSSASSQEMCKAHTSCSATEALVGESATAAGSCISKCHDHTTNPNDVPINHKDNIYLDRHNVQCPDHQTLGGMGMSDFRLATRWDYNPAKIQYRYRCCDVEDGQEVTKWTGRNDNGHGWWWEAGRSTIYLDRHNLDCGNNMVIKGFKLHTWWNDNAKIEYEYKCVPHSTATCSRYTTPANDEGNSIIYLDRHHVDCPEISKPYLKQVKLFRPSHNQIAYEYHCCA